MSLRGSNPMHELTSNDPRLFPPTLVIQSHIVDFLRWRFSQLPVGAYRWDASAPLSPEQTGCEIHISTDTPMRTAVVEARPAITVLRGGAQFQGVGIGDRLSADLNSGGRSYLDLLPTTIVINVLSRIPVVAERLAWFVQQQIFTLRETIIKTEPSLLNIGARTSISPPMNAGPLTDSPNPGWFAVTLALPTFLQYSSSAEPLNRPIFESLDLKFRAR